MITAGFDIDKFESIVPMLSDNERWLVILEAALYLEHHNCLPEDSFAEVFTNFHEQVSPPDGIVMEMIKGRELLRQKLEILKREEVAKGACQS
jgi:hypothetical protein